MTNSLNQMRSPQVLIWIIMIVIYGFLELIIGIRNRGHFRGNAARDPTFYTVTIPSMVGMYGAIVESLMKNHTFPPAWFGSGCAILACGIIIRISALVQIGRGFSTGLVHTEGQWLQTTGFYGLIRHPLYSATLLQVLGSGIMLHSWFSLAMLPVCLAGIILRIRKEERFMMDEFPEYKDYMKKTRRLIPWIY